MGLRKYLELGKIRPPVLIAFDHSFSEYLSIKSEIEDDEAKLFIDKLESKKNDKSLAWHDLYYFELVLAEYLPLEKLRSKIMRLRYDYRSVVGQTEFDDYMAAKPPDLQSPPQPADPTQASKTHYEKVLREDLKDLLGRLFLEYAILPVREERLNALTWYAASLCLIALGGLLLVLAIMFLVPLFSLVNLGENWGDQLVKLRQDDQLASLTIFVVVLVGAMGGFVSALQRIQSPSTEGDSLYNLSLLFHGSNTVFVAPITGAIFATVLYLLFSSGIIMGTFFPTIYTPEGKYAAVTEVSDTSNSNSNKTNASTPNSLTPTAESNSNSVDNVSASKPTQIKKSVPKQSLNVLDFLAGSGPGNGRDYAMLIVWCFLAGFAERFVPDVLDRLISNGRGSAGK